MASRRKAKQERKLKKLANESKPKPLWKRVKLWAAGLVLAGIVGVIAANHMRKPVPSKKAFSSKTPISEKIMKKKRRLFINLVMHKTNREVTCSLTKALERIKPEYVFLENANAINDENDFFEVRFNDKTKSGTEFFSLYPHLGKFPQYQLLHNYIREIPKDVKVFHAESYSRAELIYQNRYMKWLNSQQNSFKLLSKGEVEAAVKSWEKGVRLLAKYFRIRNDRIVETIRRKWINPNAVGLLTVGAGHRILARMFEKVGYEVKFANLMEGGKLPAHFEALERGWKIEEKFDVFSETAKELLCLSVGSRYDIIGFGSGGASLEMCRRIIKRLDLNKLKAIRRSRSWPNIIKCLVEQGYEFPQTIQDYKRKMNELKICH
jgi:hypothetical protein